MDKIKFIDEMAYLANRFADLFGQYVAERKSYFSETDKGVKIAVGHISASIQNGKLATVEVSIGACDTTHRLKINKCPNVDDEWEISDE